ncbi:MAG: class I SAM-dependent methyltransferase [Candidatus Binatia bacterium]
MNRWTMKPLGWMLLTLTMWGFAACATSLPNYSTIVANADRPANERELDAARKPSEVLAFYGVKGGDKVADLWAGRGYYTAILSEVVGPTGIVYTQNPSSRDEINQRWKNAKFANVRVADGAFDKLALPRDGSLDFVLIHLNYHDVAIEARPELNKRVLASLKPGGIYGVVDHSAQDGSGNEAVKTLHRIDKLLVIKEVTGAGFKLAKEGAMLRKPEDKRDFNVNKQRNQSDRFVLAFQRP